MSRVIAICIFFFANNLIVCMACENENVEGLKLLQPRMLCFFNFLHPPRCLKKGQKLESQENPQHFLFILRLLKHLCILKFFFQNKNIFSLHRKIFYRIQIIKYVYVLKMYEIFNSQISRLKIYKLEIKGCSATSQKEQSPFVSCNEQCYA